MTKARSIADRAFVMQEWCRGRPGVVVDLAARGPAVERGPPRSLRPERPREHLPREERLRDEAEEHVHALPGVVVGPAPGLPVLEDALNAKMLKLMNSDTKMTYTRVGAGVAPGSVADVARAIAVTIHGTTPAMQPKTWRSHCGRARPSFAASMLQPKRFIAALMPKTATRVPISWIPERSAMMTIITLEDRAYSIQRAGFLPRARLRSYQRPAGNPTMKWAAALRRKKRATIGPVGGRRASARGRDRGLRRGVEREVAAHDGRSDHRALREREREDDERLTR
jgi:hypothetical protein